MHISRCVLVLLLTVTASLLAQIGDVPAEAGQVQVSQVPADQIPPAPPLSPAEALKSFRVAPGYRLEVAASDPLVQDPVAITFGPDGRLWVVEMRGYMADLDGRGEEAPVGRISVLTDTDGDGFYDASTVFLDRQVMPRSIALVADGVMVISPPEVTFWRDTNGDGKADHATVLATDAGTRIDPTRPMRSNPESQPNSLLWAYDNWIYAACYPKKFRYKEGKWESASTPLRGQWGLSQDDFGRFYQNSNSDHLRVDIIFADYLRRNPSFSQLEGANVKIAADQFLWPARVTPGINRGYRAEMLREGRLKAFTAACGPWVYRGDLLPELYGSVFVAEPAAHVVRRTIATPEAGTLRGRNAYEQQEFVASTDERFRPVSFATGPDGALYIVDLYRGVLQHRIALTSYLRKQIEDRKLDQNHHLGRIYRVVPDGVPAKRVTRIEPMTSEAWVTRLADRNSWWRETAQRLLVERRDASVISAMRAGVRGGFQPWGRTQALWTLHGMDALDRATLIRAFTDAEPTVRTAALRLAESFLTGPNRAEWSARILELTRDRSPEVQLQAVLSAGELRDPEVDLAVAAAVRQFPGNTYLTDALFSGIAGRELVLLQRILTAGDWRETQPNVGKVLSGLARGIVGARELGPIEQLTILAAAESKQNSGRSASLVEGMEAAALATRRELRFSVEPDGWMELRQHASTEAAIKRLDSLFVWPGKAGHTPAATVVALNSVEQLRFETGKALYAATCAPCHQPSGKGVDGLAPPLLDSEWVLDLPDRLIKVVLHGLSGPLRVLGRSHTGEMPAFGALDDEQLSSVLTYIRREWGHTANPIEPAQIKAIRTATAGRVDAWTSSELTRGQPR